MLTSDRRLFLAAAEDPSTLRPDGRELCMEAAMANRHGLITGATGTGKTISLQNLAESFSALGVPVLLTDVKGDLSGLCQPGRPSGSIAARIDELGLRARGYENRAYPVCFWDVFGEQGHPLRATVSDLGPALLSRLLELNEVQSGILDIAFRIADEQGLLLLDLKDLRSMLTWLVENRKSFLQFGNISTSSAGAVLRALTRLEGAGAQAFFGEPALAMEDLFRTDLSGRGYVNVLASSRLMQQPRLYASVLLWLLSELYERLPEAGDTDKPRFVLLFDEAHLIFTNMPPVLLEKVEQVVRLIRSKGVGVYFITQNPDDIPDAVLSQLGNRIQHALRAFTPRDQKAVRAAAQTFRPNPAMNTERVIAELHTGEALVSFLNAKGAPSVVERALILPPEGGIGAVDEGERRRILAASPMERLYGKSVDRESAYEVLAREQERLRQEAQTAAAQPRRKKEERSLWAEVASGAAKQATRSMTSAIGRELGRTILRGVLGGIFGRRR